MKTSPESPRSSREFSSADVADSSLLSPSPWARRVVWAGLGFLAILAIGVVSSFLYHRFFGPTVDAALTRDLAIQQRTTEPNDSTEGSRAEEPLPGILSGLTSSAIASAAHPLDPFLEVARMAQAKILEDVADYSAVMMNEIRTSAGTIRPPQFMQIKIRHPRVADDGSKIPFSIYTRFLKPQELAGQEAIWVEGENSGNLVAHPPFMNFKRFYLDPRGALAMSDNRYPIFEMGIERLLAQMIEKGVRDRQHGVCELNLERDLEVNGRRCLRLTICHPERKAPFDFYQARIYIDWELQLPIGYEGYDWPETPGAEAPLIERYFYSEIQLNNGFTDIDWSPDNPAYQFPRF